MQRAVPRLCLGACERPGRMPQSKGGPEKRREVIVVAPHHLSSCHSRAPFFRFQIGMRVQHMSASDQRKEVRQELREPAAGLRVGQEGRKRLQGGGERASSRSWLAVLQGRGGGHDVLHASHLSFVLPEKVCTCVETDFLCPAGVNAKVCTKLCAKEGKAASWSKSKLLGPNGDAKCSNVRDGHCPWPGQKCSSRRLAF